MNINPGKTEFTEAEHRDLIERVRSIGIAQADIARQADIAPATLSQYLGGIYTSEPGRTTVAGKLTRLLKSREAEAELRRQLPIAPAFMKLTGAQTITRTLAYARETGRLVQLTGVPGTGKTATARQFAADYPRTWYAAMDPTTGGVPTMLLALLRATGDTDAKGTPQSLMDRFCLKAAEAKGLLIIDESQHLTVPAIEALRAINDRIRVGIAMLGNEIASARVGTTGAKPEFAQISSRIAMRRWFPAPDPKDAAALAEAWAATNDEVVTAREIAFCQQIAARPGGLRNIEMTMEGALMAARGAQEPLGLEHLQGAFAQLSGIGPGR